MQPLSDHKHGPCSVELRCLQVLRAHQPVRAHTPRASTRLRRSEEGHEHRQLGAEPTRRVEQKRLRREEKGGGRMPA
eukprot:2997121-Pleurochrysis_carterae.AAC.2